METEYHYCQRKLLDNHPHSTVFVQATTRREMKERRIYKVKTMRSTTAEEPIGVSSLLLVLLLLLLLVCPIHSSYVVLPSSSLVLHNVVVCPASDRRRNRYYPYYEHSS